MFFSYLDFRFKLKGLLLGTYLLIMILTIKIEKQIENRSKYKNLNFFILSFIFIAALNIFFNLLSILITNAQNELDYNTLDFLKFIVVFPILEEFFFRKKIFNLLIFRNSPRTAILTTSLGFVGCHFYSDSGLISVFIFSLFITWIYLIYDDIRLCVFLHISNNLLTYFLFKSTFLSFVNEFKYIILCLSSIMMVYSFVTIMKKSKKQI